MIEKELLLNLKMLESLSYDELKVALDVDSWAFKNEFESIWAQKETYGISHALLSLNEWNLKKAFDYAKGIDSLKKFRHKDLVQFNPHSCNSESVRRCIGSVKHIDRDRKVMTVEILSYGEISPVKVECYAHEVKLCGKEIFGLDPSEFISCPDK